MTHRALTSPDVLYHIFMLLSQHDLLTVQRVCRTWCDVIADSKSLLAALFLHPPTIPVEPGHVQLNPLLRTHFPLFFGFDPSKQRLAPRDSSLGPWNGASWTDCLDGPGRLNAHRAAASGRSETKSLDGPGFSDASRRAAAFARPEASWRRMIPCMPPPRELQVHYDCRKFSTRDGKLRILRFANAGEQGAVINEHARPTTISQVRRHRWLTFGLLHDILESAWFQGEPEPADDVQFDYSFEGSDPTIIDSNTRFYSPRKHLRATLADRTIGGPYRLLVLLRGHQDIRAPEFKTHKGDFMNPGFHIGDFEWDEVVDSYLPKQFVSEESQARLVQRLADVRRGQPVEREGRLGRGRG